MRFRSHSSSLQTVQNCACVSGGRSSSLQGDRLTEAEEAFRQLQARLGSVPRSVVDALEGGLPKNINYRKSWRQPPGTSDFMSVTEWLAHAAGTDGAGASISRNIGVEEFDQLGPQIGNVFLELVDAAAPLLNYCYLGEAPESAMAPSRLDWTREEVILAMDLYVTAGAFGGGPIPADGSAETIQLSELLKKLSAYPPELQGEKYRNPDGVYLKLMNLRAVETDGAHGMNAYSQHRCSGMARLCGRPTELHAEAEAIRLVCRTAPSGLQRPRPLWKT